MRTAQRFLLTSALAASLALPARAYNDVVTHPQLTVVATQKSALYTDGAILFSLGLLPADKQLFIYGARAGTVRAGSARYSLSAFVAEGAFDEDVGTRALNHFFDPALDRPLTFVRPLGERSWRWMLEDQGPIEDQDRSIADARAFLFKALTFTEGSPAEAYNARGIAIASMFLSLGHVAHHMQDMTQPQHVRNDMHLDKYALLGLNPFYNPSRFERYTAARSGAVQMIAQGANPNFPGSPDFRVARDFWFNGNNTGVGQYTNRNFVSQGTNFTISGMQVNTGTYALPVPGEPVPYTVEELHTASGIPVPQQIQTLCGVPAIDCTMTMYSTLVQQRASTLSIFDQDLRFRGLFVTYTEGDITPTYITHRLFDLNRFNFDDALPHLIGQAVAYSAGFINHFFRGKLQVTAPPSGPFAVVDHTPGGTGFTSIRARVTNSTPGEALPAGTIQAIARFHRNNCYKDDLSGEFTINEAGQLIPPCPDWRSEEAHLRLTAEEATSFGVGETKEMTFTFTEPIPFNATDLIIQVLYRGTVGTEQGTFALGAVDVSEPTFLAVMNATDVFELSGTAFYYYTDIIAGIADPPFDVIDIDGNDAFNVPPDVDVRGGNIAYEMFLNGKKAGDIPVLPEGRFARIAALVGPSSFRLDLRAVGNGFNSLDAYIFPSKTFQYDPAQNAIIVSIVDRLRNHTFQFDSVSYFHFYPVTATPLDDMPPSLATDATVAIPVQIAPQ